MTKSLYTNNDSKLKSIMGMVRITAWIELVQKGEIGKRGKEKE